MSGLGDGNNSLFVMDLNGTLQTGVEFDYESYQSLSIRVAAMDEDNASVEGEFLVSVTDVNETEEGIVFMVSGGGWSYPFYQFEDSDGQTVDFSSYIMIPGLTYEFKAAGVSGSHPFMVGESVGDMNSPFVTGAPLTSDAGSIILEIPPDYQGDFYYFCTDHGSMAAPFQIAASNQAPVGLYHVGSLTVPENEPAGTYVGTFLAQDPDGDTMIYHLASGLGDANNSMFFMDTNGTLRTDAPFDYESYQSLSIRVAVMDEHGASVEDEFLVAITDVNETDSNQAPVGLSHVGSLTVPENEPAGTFVGTFLAQDPDGDALTYHLTSGQGDENNSLFVMDANGTLRTEVEFDYESYQSLSIRVAATDEHNASVEDMFSVVVLDVSEPNQPPENLYSIGDLKVMENLPVGTIVGEFNATDPEGGELVYMLTGGAGAINNSMFTMDVNGTLRTAEIFDHESNDFLSIRVAVLDELYEMTSMSFVVQVQNDVDETEGSPPVDLNATMPLEIYENQPAGTLVGTFEAEDPEGGSLFYFLMNTEDSLDNPKFTLESNGTLLSAQEFDYELTPRLQVRVGVLDNDNLLSSAVFEVMVVDINDTMDNLPPVNLHSINPLSIQENMSPGTFIGEFNATDPEGGELFYFLTQGDGDEHNSMFTLESNGILRSASTYDYESNHSLMLRVGVMDLENQILEGAFEVEIIDQNESSENLAPYDLSVVGDLLLESNASVGTFIADFNASDPEEDELTFYLADGVGDSGNENFVISDAGALSLGKEISIDSNLTFLLVRIGVRDIGGAFEEGVFEVRILEAEDHSPIEPGEPFSFSSDELKVPENVPPGEVVGRFFATGGVVEGTGVLFSLGSNNDLFELDLNGTLKTRVSFDFEDLNDSGIEIQVVAQTEFNQFAVDRFLVEIIDVNDSEVSQSFDFNATSLSVMENVPIGTRFGQFFGVADDSNASFKFHIEDPNSLFEIDDMGFLKTRVALDYDHRDLYNLKIEVTAENDFNQTKTGVFEVSIIDVNHKPEDIELSGEALLVGEDATSHDLGNFHVLDDDENDFHEISLIDGFGSGDNELFQIDGNGTLRFVGEEMISETRELNIRVRATDLAAESIEKSFTIQYEHKSGDSVVLLADGKDLGAGWKRAGWFGQYFGDFFPWVHHENLGWLFVEQKGEGDVWFFREGLGWTWTNIEMFPYLYLVERQEWAYLDRSVFPARLFDYSYMEWFLLDRPYEINLTVEPNIGGSVSGGGMYYRWDNALIEAVPDEGFEFAGWSGDISSDEPVLEIEVYQNLNLQASFTPTLKPGGSASDSIRSLNEYVDSLDDLSPEEKKAAMAKILIYGRF